MTATKSFVYNCYQPWPARSLCRSSHSACVEIRN